jgi:hypothetical protein
MTPGDREHRAGVLQEDFFSRQRKCASHAGLRGDRPWRPRGSGLQTIEQHVEVAKQILREVGERGFRSPLRKYVI